MNLRTFFKSLAAIAVTPWQFLKAQDALNTERYVWWHKNKMQRQCLKPLKRVVVKYPSEIKPGMIVKIKRDSRHGKGHQLWRVNRKAETGELYRGEPLHNEWENKFFLAPLGIVYPEIKAIMDNSEILCCFDQIIDRKRGLEFYA